MFEISTSFEIMGLIGTLFIALGISAAIVLVACNTGSRSLVSIARSDSGQLTSRRTSREKDSGAAGSDGWIPGSSGSDPASCDAGGDGGSD